MTLRIDLIIYSDLFKFCNLTSQHLSTIEAFDFSIFVFDFVVRPSTMARKKKRHVKVKKKVVVAEEKDEEDISSSSSSSFESDDSNNSPTQPTSATKRRDRGAAGRGNKKRAKRAALETFYLVDSNGEIVPTAQYKGKCDPTVVDCAIKLAKKAWGRNKHLQIVELEHERTGNRYTFNSDEWSDNSGGRPKFCNKGAIEPLRITTSRQTNSKNGGPDLDKYGRPYKNQSTGLTPTIGRLNM